jgi:hypothetical protein
MRCGSPSVKPAVTGFRRRCSYALLGAAQRGGKELADNVRFLSGDGFVSPEAAIGHQVLAVEGTPDAAIVHVFDSDDEFENWVRTTPHANSVMGILQNIQDLHNLQNHPERAHAERTALVGRTKQNRK